MTAPWHTEITLFEKQGGPLSKSFSLDPNGKLNNDASACLMVQGIAQRIEISEMSSYADLVNTCRGNQALALGRLRDGLPDRVSVVINDKLNGGVDPTTIARTKDFLIFEPGAGGLVLLDFDPKGMSAEVRRRFNECGDLIAALVTVLPALETAAMVERPSTSAGLRNTITGQAFTHSGGKHLVIPVVDAADIPRFLAGLHDRCWLAGFGWGLVSSAGSFLERSIVDKSCGSPERLIFEGAPVIEPPLAQDARLAVVHEGTVLDTRLCEPLNDAERLALEQLIAAEELRLLPERQAARSSWSLQHIKRLIDRGIPETEARRQVDHWIDHKELSGAFPLPFDDNKRFGTTVEQVLADPDKFINETLADPHEGVSYGRGKAIIYRRDDGSLFIHSFAHGGINYDLVDGGKPRIIKSSAEFVAGFVPPDYILDGILQQGFLYSLTGQTGSGKTSITLRLAASAALGLIFAGRETKKSRVLYLAAENPDDARLRWIALAQHMDFDPNAIEVFFSDHRFTISKTMPALRGALEQHGGEFGLVIVDTGPAFFEGDDENSRAQMGAHAKMFRDLIDIIPGRPCILVNCHPVKNATPDNLLPAGGGTFLNEMDGNLTVAKTESTVELHWQGKFRGPEFAPMHFLIKTVTHQDLKDKKGRLIPTCLCEWLSEQHSEEIAARKTTDENRVLELISQNPKITQAAIASAMEWKLYSGEPYKSKAGRAVDALIKAKLVKKTRTGLQLTREGKKILQGETVDEQDEPDEQTGTIVPFRPG